MRVIALGSSKSEDRVRNEMSLTSEVSRENLDA